MPQKQDQTQQIRWADPSATIIFYHMGAHIKECINRKLQEQLKPRYASYMNRIRELLQDAEGEVKPGMKAAAIVSALFLKEKAHEAQWLELLAKCAAETLQQIDKLEAIERSTVTNVMYIFDQSQAAEFGV